MNRNARVGGISFFSLTRPALVRQAIQYIEEHRARGCGAFGGTETYTDAGRLVKVPCSCLCPDHPCRTDYLFDPVYVCATCRDTGITGSGAHDLYAPSFGRAQPCRECHTDGERRSFMYARQLVGFPAELLDDFRLDNLEDRAGDLVKTYTETWIGNPKRPPLFTLAGPTGTGKTHAALAACREWIRDGRYALIVVAGELLEELRASNRRGAEQSAAEIIRRPLAVDLLVIDDLKPPGTEYGEEQLFRLIDRRYREHRATIITTNETPATVRRDRLWSRVFGDRLATVCETAGSDRRFGA